MVVSFPGTNTNLVRAASRKSEVLNFEAILDGWPGQRRSPSGYPPLPE
jgi:hypothetical protein